MVPTGLETDDWRAAVRAFVEANPSVRKVATPVVTSALTRAIQRRHGYKPVPYTCAECGHTRPPLSSFPTSNVFGLSALAWSTSGRRVLLGATIHCPSCGEPMTFDEEMARRRRRRSQR